MKFLDDRMVESSPIFRRAEATDFESLIDLQEANLAGNLSPDQKSDGFLSVRFGAEQFAEMDAALAVIVGLQDQVVKAFLCTSTVQFNLAFALPSAMIARFPHALYDCKPLSGWHVCICGPVCIDKTWRGQGVLKLLYDAFYQIVPPQFELATVFVAQDNPRSIRAHQKLGMQIIDEFEFNARKYVIMAGRIQPLADSTTPAHDFTSR